MMFAKQKHVRRVVRIGVVSMRERLIAGRAALVMMMVVVPGLTTGCRFMMTIVRILAVICRYAREVDIRVDDAKQKTRGRQH